MARLYLVLLAEETCARPKCLNAGAGPFPSSLEKHLCHDISGLPRQGRGDLDSAQRLQRRFHLWMLFSCTIQLTSFDLGSCCCPASKANSNWRNSCFTSCQKVTGSEAAFSALAPAARISSDSTACVRHTFTTTVRAVHVGNTRLAQSSIGHVGRVGVKHCSLGKDQVHSGSISAAP